MLALSQGLKSPKKKPFSLRIHITLVELPANIIKIYNTVKAASCLILYAVSFKVKPIPGGLKNYLGKSSLLSRKRLSLEISAILRDKAKKKLIKKAQKYLTRLF
jgi:hypothetical protein